MNLRDPWKMKATIFNDTWCFEIKKEDIFTLCGKPQIETDHDKKCFQNKVFDKLEPRSSRLL